MTLLQIVYPIIAFALLTLGFWHGRTLPDLGEASLKAFVSLFLFVAIATGLASPFLAVTEDAFRFGWQLLIGLSLVYLILTGGYRRIRPLRLPRLDRSEIFLCAVIGLILFLTLLTAILYPPNNGDSMTYHLARVANWIHNQSIEFYATADMRHNYQMPLSEYMILHLQLLTGTDLFANCVQWASFFMLIILGMLVSRELGLTRWNQLLSAVIIASLPMAVLQASSTQNDLVVAVFLFSFAYFLLRMRSVIRPSGIVMAGSSFGLALLTKGTALLFAPSIGVFLSLQLAWFHRKRATALLKISGSLTAVVLLALLITCGHFMRNYDSYGHPLSTEGEAYKNEASAAIAVSSNLLRNAALHTGTPFTVVNALQARILGWLLGPEIDNPQTTWQARPFRIPFSFHEDAAGNLLHAGMFIFAALMLPIVWRRQERWAWLPYAAALAGGVILYCLLLKWQPWGSRLQTPLFVMAAPLLVLILSQAPLVSRPFRRLGLPGCLAGYAILFAVYNESRPLASAGSPGVDRDRAYFANRQYLEEDYGAVIQFMAGTHPGEVGLFFQRDDWEYPLWAISRQMEDGSNLSFRHIGVDNASSTMETNSGLPRYVIATRPISDWKNGFAYSPLLETDSLTLYERILPL